MEAQFKAGAAEQLDALNARLESAVSRLVLLEGRVKLQQAIGWLEDAVQRPLDAAAAPPPFLFNPRSVRPRPEGTKEMTP